MSGKSRLFSPLQLRSITLPNRIVVSPMCQYSSEDGFANDWHLVHLGARAQGGAGLVITEAAAVLPEGRITPQDLGIWKDEHVVGLRRITDFLHSQGTWAGIQLAHAGRKGSMSRPWEEERVHTPATGGWQPVAPSAIPFDAHYGRPSALEVKDIAAVVKAFILAARRAREAGFDVVEIHAAHGYLLHEFLSPLSNHRTDLYGGSFENRIRLLLEVVDAVRAEWPEQLPLFVRISATDWAEGGWNPEESIALARQLGPKGVDLVDVSSGGLLPNVHVPVGPGYQAPFAERIRREANVATGAVGMITEPDQAEEVLQAGKADLIIIARELLRDAYWPIHAAQSLGEIVSWPVQYLRAAEKGTLPRQAVSFPEERILSGSK
jgi:2,4-dienoyl-CoA reductase-like NADH-dependent reductase (Old Yellow Enzyme family)